MKNAWVGVASCEHVKAAFSHSERPFNTMTAMRRRSARFSRSYLSPAVESHGERRSGEASFRLKHTIYRSLLPP